MFAQQRCSGVQTNAECGTVNSLLARWSALVGKLGNDPKHNGTTENGAHRMRIRAENNNSQHSHIRSPAAEGDCRKAREKNTSGLHNGINIGNDYDNQRPSIHAHTYTQIHAQCCLSLFCLPDCMSFLQKLAHTFIKCMSPQRARVCVGMSEAVSFHTRTEADAGWRGWTQA